MPQGSVEARSPTSSAELSTEHPGSVRRRHPVPGTTARLVAVRGADDDIVPAEFTLPPGLDGIEAIDVPDADHFDLIDPSNDAWTAVVALLGPDRCRELVAEQPLHGRGRPGRAIEPHLHGHAARA